MQHPMSERFSRNTALALEVQAEIMKLPLDPGAPMYGAWSEAYGFKMARLRLGGFFWQARQDIAPPALASLPIVARI